MADIGDDQRFSGRIGKHIDHPQRSLRGLKHAAGGQPQALRDALIDENGPGVEEEGREYLFPYRAAFGFADPGRDRPDLPVEKGIHAQEANLLISCDPQIPVDDGGKSPDRRIGQEPWENPFLHRTGRALDRVRRPAAEKIDGGLKAPQGGPRGQRHAHRRGHAEGDAEELEDAQTLSPEEIAQE